MNPQENNPGGPQAQAIERLRTAVNVLVTVSNNPSVDQLAAAIGFTLTLNKMGKHATAVFSGDVPSTMKFLKPETTIEKNTDSLRDFIVSLDKAKADKLRYKVEENVVKIFITPYKTSLSEKDLNFSQGDFNVDAVVALGVSQREQLDQAIISHGRILHDATVITVSAGKNTSTLGAINWQDPAASSLSEMLVGIADTLQPGLLDGQIATAYLTGIVAETERFRNEKTTPKIMSMSAQLMAAGANQQLIASELDHVKEVPLQKAPSPAPAAPAEDIAKEVPEDGALEIEHEPDTMPEVLGSEAPEKKEELPALPSTMPAGAPGAKADENGIDEITIDDHGIISKPGEEPAPKEEAETPRHRIIQPLTDAQKTAVGSAPYEPHPFSSSMSVENETEPNVDPLMPPSENAHDGMLDHNATTGMTLPPVAATDTLSAIERTVSSPHMAEDPTSTLSQVEQAVASPHVAEAAGQVSAAQDAVQNVLDNTPYNPDRPAPLAALNAEHVDLGAPEPVLPPAPAQPPAAEPEKESAPDPSGQAPPPLPPPFVPTV
jgi:nanoRNase/pAp phosphatase (c-di-AMP/oligoRNAs hydrolase)